MATNIRCDGCDARLVSPVHVGLAQKGDYCDECAEVAKAFYSDLDNLHTEIAREWKIGLDELVNEFVSAHPGFVIPDFTEKR